MEETGYALNRSCTAGGGRGDYFQLVEDIREPMMATPPSEPGSSFTALLKLPANQAIQLLHSPYPDASSAVHRNPYDNIYGGSPTFPSDAALVGRAERLSATFNQSNHSANFHKPKCEPTDADSYPDSASPLVSDPVVQRHVQNSGKRKERQKKVNGSLKKGKMAANASSTEAERFPCIHVRARRGQATDSHSLAERARRDKINARMKLLQELVPGCNKITGTALVLDEIIHHVQSLQQQVELLSMKLAAINPRIDSSLDCLMATSMGGSQMESNLHEMIMPLMWQGSHTNNPYRQQQYEQQEWQTDALHLSAWERGGDTQNLLTPHNSLLS